MKYTFRSFFVAIAAALAFAAAGCGGESSPPAAADPDAPLVLVTTGQTPPYSYRDEATGEIVGEEIEIARAAAEQLGRALEVRIARFPELLPMVGAGEADLAASGITITEGRRQTVDFSEPFVTEGGMFLYRTDETEPTMFRAERMRVATIDASTYDFYLTSHGVDPMRYETFDAAMAAFRERRVDTVFYDSCTARIVAEESGGKIAASPLQTRENFGIAVRKGNAALKAALDEAIAERSAP
ncbi:MAG: amino acid ABC transporter substrate-binding protein [Kiritimatiellae bacterium]|nr:amino acid ABC transporter substrate-binding protein [Kiritimatiellia bacterium]